MRLRLHSRCCSRSGTATTMTTDWIDNGREFSFWPRCQYWTAETMTAAAAAAAVAVAVMAPPTVLLRRWKNGSLPPVGRASRPKSSRPFVHSARSASRVHRNRTPSRPLDASGLPSASAEGAAAAAAASCASDLPPPFGGCCCQRPCCFPSSASGTDRTRTRCCGCARSRRRLVVRPTRPDWATRLSEERRRCHLPGDADDWTVPTSYPSVDCGNGCPSWQQHPRGRRERTVETNQNHHPKLTLLKSGGILVPVAAPVHIK